MVTNALVVDTFITSTSYTASNLAAGRTYRWNVAAKNSAGASNYTTPLYFTTLGGVGTPTPTPTAPPGQSLTISSVLPSAIQQRDWGQSVNYTITVLDSQGKPVQGASVVANDDLKSQSILASTTNLNGQSIYQTSVPVGKVDGYFQITFQTSAPGYSNGSNTISRQVQVQHVAATPIVQVTSPHSGVNWPVGSTQFITANVSASVTSYVFEYSTGGAWFPIGNVSTNAAAITTQWQVPNAPSTNCRVKITVNYAGGSTYAISDYFTISSVLGAGCQPIVVTPQTQVHPGKPWGYQNLQAMTCWGCSVTALAMAMTQGDPTHSAEYEVETLNGVLAFHGGYSPVVGGPEGTCRGFPSYKNGSDIQWTGATRVGSGGGIAPTEHGRLKWNAEIRNSGLVGQNSYVEFESYLKSKLCGPTGNAPIVVKVNRSGSTHFVLVTGAEQSGNTTRFAINDPADGIHIAKYLDYYPAPWETRGYVSPDTATLNKRASLGLMTPDLDVTVPGILEISGPSTVTISLIDPTGNITGRASAADGSGSQQIPLSAAFSDANSDPETGESTIGASFVELSEPMPGLYEIVVKALQSGPYSVSISAPGHTGEPVRIAGYGETGVSNSYFIRIGGSSNLTVAQTVSTAFPQVGTAITYSFRVTNSGSTDASAVTVFDALPIGATLVSVEGAQYFYDAVAGKAVLMLNTLETGESGTVKITIVPTRAGNLQNRVEVSSVEMDTSSGDNVLFSDSLVVDPSAKVNLGNIATRLAVGLGDNAMIGGFIITGTQPKTVIVRGIGPSLAAFGVQGALSDPVIEVYDSGGVLRGTNDNWNDAETRQQIINSGLAPTNELESALWGTINPGAYTVVVRGKDNGTGVGLFEVYDLNQSSDSKLANISTRGFVNAGDNVMIGGTIIVGSSPTKVLIRAIGPSLTSFGVPNALQDPKLELHDSNGALIASNDNWRSDQEADISATTVPPTDDRESAILRTLWPGAYTAIVRGSGNSTGVALVEAYQLQ
jgi:uncharacterized repeat protein (TIGR01451 family)